MIGVGSAVILAGVLIAFVPYLTAGRLAVTGIPAPPALEKVNSVALAPGGQACMSSVAVPQRSRLARLRLSPLPGQGGPPLELVLRAPRYESRTQLRAGYGKGRATMPILAPPRAMVGTACFVNRGTRGVLLDGTTEPRTASRSALRLDGRPVAGDIALEFLDDRRPSLLDRTAEVFDRASNLTDRLVPPWLIWILAALVALGVPCGTLAAFYLALREDNATAS
ncbi:MAG TPA: hypothetical protein VHY83_12475 [Solirubrobacteraceae bacterium]|nr:hypothetical protein [Solirubrobacteraceae bacterium]